MSLGLQTLADSPFLGNLGPGERSLWRFLVALFGGILLFVVVTLVTILITFAVFVLVLGWPLQEIGTRYLALSQSNGRSFADAMQIIGFALPSNIVPMYAFVGITALAHHRRIGALFTAASRFRWRMMLAGAALSVLIIGPFLALGQLLDPKAAAPPLLTVSPLIAPRVIYALVCVLAFTPAAMGEEFLFRGWLLRQTSNVTRQPLVLMAVNGVVFAAAHFDFAPDAFLERALMGAGFTYATLRLGGVEMACGMHAANNLMLVLFLQPLTLQLSPGEPLDAGSLIADAGLVAAYIAMTELMARWAPLRRWAQGPLPPPASAEAEQFS